MEPPEAPAQLSPRPPSVLGGRAGAPRSRPGWRPRATRAPKPPRRSAGRAGSCPSAPGSGPNGGSQPSRAGHKLARVSWPRGGPRRSFQGAAGLPLRSRRHSSSEKRRGGGGSVPSRGRRGREAPLAQHRGDGKRKAPGIYTQNVG